MVLGRDRRGLLSSECLYPPQIEMLKPKPKGDGIRKWGLQEVIKSWEQSPPSWIRAYMKAALRKLPCPFCHVRFIEALSKHWICPRHDLGLHNLQYCVDSSPASLQYFCDSSPDGLKQEPIIECPLESRSFRNWFSSSFRTYPWDRGPYLFYIWENYCPEKLSNSFMVTC